MIDDSIKLARLWTELFDLKEKLDNEIIPVGSYLSIEDPELMIALEELSEKIENHFQRFRLVGVVRKTDDL